MASVSQTWGTEAQERELTYPCDRFIPQPEAALYRGVTIDAPAEIVFRWLCQMRVAPYSYDWIDNFGRSSPRQLSPGIENLAVGQDMMTIFDLVDFEVGRHVTIRIKLKSIASKIFGDAAASYLIVPGDKACRLLVKLVGRYPRGVMGMFMRTFLPWGDLIMMRRQLLNFKQLAERESANNSSN
ncbi:MAG: hypothetical protein M3R52_08080 [Acidobacteriota bacterium]|nr:hypothetical protein [Acidobacteriota bacterium]